MSDEPRNRRPGGHAFNGTLPQDLYGWLADRAQLNGRTVIGEIRAILQNTRRADQTLAKIPSRPLRFAIIEEVQGEAQGQ